MKKLVLTLVMGVFAFGSSGFIYFNSDCEDYALQSVNAEQDAFGDYGNHVDYVNAYYSYYNSCVGSGGNISEPILIKG